MDINGAFPSNYLKAADLQGRRIAVTVREVAMEDIGGDHKPVLYFQGKDKGVVLNKTNANMISEIAGTTETDEWAGVKIVLYPDKTDFQGKRVACIRMDYPAADGKQQPAFKPAPKREPGEDDDIPW